MVTKLFSLTRADPRQTPNRNLCRRRCLSGTCPLSVEVSGSGLSCGVKPSADGPAMAHKASRYLGNRAFSFGSLLFKQFLCLRRWTDSIQFAELCQYITCSYPAGGGSLRRDQIVVASLRVVRARSLHSRNPSDSDICLPARALGTPREPLLVCSMTRDIHKSPPNFPSFQFPVQHSVKRMSTAV
jgi:hypothetical protein